MIYLEKVLNDRIEELKKENYETLDNFKIKLNQDRLDCTFDIEDCYLEMEANEIRINELELLKKGLGLTPAEEELREVDKEIE